jgi:vacuolar-type H+-ATPase subunit I/STV1
MSCIVYQVDSKNGTKYAYESISYWDKEKQQPRSKRKYIGKVDPETGEIIKGRSKRNSVSYDLSDTNESDNLIISKLEQELSQKENQIESLSNELALLSTKYDKAQLLLRQISSLANVLAEDTNV